MPVQTSPSPLPASFPSFSSVFGTGMDHVLRPQRRDDGPSPAQPATTSSTASAAEPCPSFQHRESVSSAASESTDSSPTTTISTFDTTSVPDTSPSSSPESPSSIPLPYPKPTTLPDISERDSMPSDQNAQSQQPTLGSARPVSPGRRARNLKNLSLKVPSQPSRPAISTASVVETSSCHLSAPPSPVNRPMKTARRKPANLTIRTPGFDSSFSSNATEAVPPTPGTRRSLRHIESSPSLASVFSPTTAPPGGMQMPRPATRDGAPTMPGSWQDDFSPRPPSREALQKVEEEDYNLDSRESAKGNERGYPDGPIQIYESGVYLYLEPTQEEASRFDVVVNVAKEVVNPFTADLAKNNNSVVSTLRDPCEFAKRHSIAEPLTAISEASFHSALEVLSPESESPTTPKAKKRATPEYIHVPWDHNSEILDDLYPLCELIDDRVSQDKSRWVGPNMSLIYQLTDFRARLLRGGPSKPAPAEWFKIGPNCRPSEASAISNPPAADRVEEPKRDDRESQTLVPGPLLHSSTERPATTAPSTTATASTHLPKSEAPAPRSIFPRPLPLREKYQTIEPSQGPSENQQSGTRRTAHIRYPSVRMDLVMKDVPTSPSLLSPRAASFMSTTLSRTLAGDLAGDGPPSLVGLGEPFPDPRSPPQRNEPLIMRNIDEFL
ncbi:Protein-tyrosine phosphatase [Rasamsonia emersonii CBS 393.64]|uniref:Protein-tyrosine phosphatase n=1 Tax=Rasamsonia emersonii (strain ATCC 16479 / CBS 393.64 / IMI 116815) TaxID=1408163 RepID=A0A0F4YJ44_RASE3|nr:Protein-tyrosine phosphatase [Rasamsonia emersonii CBS 393.64]KKA18125.1 Protein-tyrosine phosphatase [Rasamsonia emersonii CBS 393.64]